MSLKLTYRSLKEKEFNHHVNISNKKIHYYALECGAKNRVMALTQPEVTCEKCLHLLNLDAVKAARARTAATTARLKARIENA